MKFFLLFLMCSAFLGCFPNLLYAQNQAGTEDSFSDQIRETVYSWAMKLSDKDVEVRKVAAYKLILFRGWARVAQPELLQALKDPDPTVRANAACCFVFLGPGGKAAIPLLADLLKDKDTECRRVAAEVLRQFGPLARQAAPALLRALEDKDQRVRLRAAGALAWMGEGGQKPFQMLAESLNEEDRDLRHEAIDSLGRTGVLAFPVLKACLQDKRPRVRSGAMCAFGLFGSTHETQKQKLPQEVVVLLAHALNDRSKEFVVGSLCTLENLGEPAKEAIPQIIKCLSHSDWEVRYRAARCLRAFGPAAKAARPALEKARWDSYPIVGEQAEETLGQLAKKKLSDEK